MKPINKKLYFIFILFIIVLFFKSTYDFIFQDRTLYYIQPVSFIHGNPVENYYVAHTNANKTKTIIVISNDDIIIPQNPESSLKVCGQVIGLTINYEDVWGISMPYITYIFQINQILN